MIGIGQERLVFVDDCPRLFGAENLFLNVFVIQSAEPGLAQLLDKFAVIKTFRNITGIELAADGGVIGGPGGADTAAVITPIAAHGTFFIASQLLEFIAF